MATPFSYRVPPDYVLELTLGGTVGTVVGALTDSRSRAAGALYGMGTILLARAAARPVWYRTAEFQCSSGVDVPSTLNQVITERHTMDPETSMMMGLFGVALLGLGAVTARYAKLRGPQ